jgi:hypothetical protein
LIVQALIMFYATSRRNKEIQISLDNMTKSRQRFIEEQNTLLESRVIERTQELQMQTEKTEKLMLNILPQSIAERLKDGDKEVSDKYQNTTILFSDLVGFTKMSSEKTPEELVFLLNDLLALWLFNRKFPGALVPPFDSGVMWSISLPARLTPFASISRLAAARLARLGFSSRACSIAHSCLYGRGDFVYGISISLVPLTTTIVCT